MPLRWTGGNNLSESHAIEIHRNGGEIWALFTMRTNG